MIWSKYASSVLKTRLLASISVRLWVKKCRLVMADTTRIRSIYQEKVGKGRINTTLIYKQLIWGHQNRQDTVFCHRKKNFSFHNGVLFTDTSAEACSRLSGPVHSPMGLWECIRWQVMIRGECAAWWPKFTVCTVVQREGRNWGVLCSID